MREYDQVFVYKNMFKTKKDASTQTNQGERESFFLKRVRGHLSVLGVGVTAELLF